MSGGYRDDDLAYGSYRGQGEEQESQEGERGLLGDTLGSFLGKKPAGRQSVSFGSVCDELNELNALNCSLLLSRIPHSPTNRSPMENSRLHMVNNNKLRMVNNNKLRMVNNSKLLTVNNSKLPTVNSRNNNNRVMASLLPVTANKDLKVLPRVAAHSS